MTGDTTWYRRVVASGGLEGVCKDTSAVQVINVLPSITNNEVMAAGEVYCQYDLLGELTQDPAGGNTPGGGATRGGTDSTRNYKWEVSVGAAPGTWTELAYGSDSIHYRAHPELTSPEDYWYRRTVFSGPDLGGQEQVCQDISDTLHIVIHTAISGNTIDAADSACHNTEKTLQGAVPVGEQGLTPSYTWLDAVSGAVLGSGQDQPYTFAALEDRQFVREAVIGVCEDTSAPMEITVMELPGGILSGGLPEACEKIIQLDVDLNMEELTRFVLPWEVSLSDGVDTAFLSPQSLEADGTVDVELTTEDISTQYNYTIGKLAYLLTDGTECRGTRGKPVGKCAHRGVPDPETGDHCKNHTDRQCSV